MEIITVDAETYYDRDYSLRKMTPVEYLLDPRFEMIMLSVKPLLKAPYILEGSDIDDFLDDLRKREVVLISHNALFDMCLLSFRYNYVPNKMVDTMGLARAKLAAFLPSLSLGSVAAHLDVGTKGKAIHNVIGMGRAAIKAAGLWDSFVQYAKDDAALCEGIFMKLGLDFPADELAIMDMVLRCAVEPKLQLDRAALATHLHNVTTHKEQLLAQVLLGGGAEGRSAIMSNDQFAELLRQRGVTPPTKVSPTTGRTTYAFAKTDQAFLDLQEHPDPMVQTLVTARLGLKSTLEETRTQRLINIGNLQWPHHPVTSMPIPLRYSGAHTHRLSGDWKVNMQNLPSRTKDGDQIRRALIAARGYKIVVADSSQIEARIVAELAGQDDLVEAFRQRRDVYSEFASTVFHRLITKADKPERFVGKTSILQLGFGAGWLKFQHSIALGSLAQTGQLIDLSDAEAQRIVTGYRTTYSKIPQMWQFLQQRAIPILAGLVDGVLTIKGGVTFQKGFLTLPNGMKIFYPDLKRDDNGEWTYRFGRETRRLYGGALFENIVQALARIVTMNAALRIKRRLARWGWGLALQVHDELAFVVPDAAVELVKQMMLEEMCVPPWFLPNLPLAAEAGSGVNYGEAK